MILIYDKNYFNLMGKERLFNNSAGATGYYIMVENSPQSHILSKKQIPDAINA